MSQISHFRDEYLGTALAVLDVPDHDPGFFDELEEQLRTVGRRRLRPLTRTRVLAGAAVAAATAVLAVTLLPRLITGEEVAQARTVEARLAAAIAGTQTARGELTYTAVDADGEGRVTTRQSFVLDAAGDRRIVDLSDKTESAYDPARGVERAITTSASIGSGRFYAERTGLAPGAPDTTASEPLLESQLGAVTRALAVAHDPHVREVDLDGVPAWQLDVPVAANTIAPDIDHLSVTVDRATGFPLRVVASLGGRFRSVLRVESLQLDALVPPGTFTVRFPSNAEVLRTDSGFANVDLERAGEVVGYPPLVPKRLPNGFRLATIAVAAATDRTGPAQSNPPSRGVVSLSYRRGLEHVVVTTRRRAPGRWRDPFAVAGVPLLGERVGLAGGAFDRTAAEVVVDPRSLPHLWAVGDQLVLTVAGDAGRAELIEIAEALQ